MRFSELVKASWHALIANPKRSFLTTIGIIKGIASVVTIMSLGAGVKKQIRPNPGNKRRRFTTIHAICF